MLKSKLFDGDSDDEDATKINVNNSYASNYNIWRKKEELNKFKARYGESALDSDSSSSTDGDDECFELEESLEQNFLKTLSSLKKKDPKIYDRNIKFFKDEAIDPTVKKKKADNPMYIHDYERNLLLEKGGELSDEDDETTKRPISPTYVEEQNQLKQNLKAALKNIDEDDNEEWGGLMKKREKSKEDQENEEAEYKKWLIGQKESLEDPEMESELKPLKEFWTDPDLDQGEKFLRDYILNKKFMENEDSNRIPSYDEIVHDSDQSLTADEEEIDKQEIFEHKYNYRFEEPDQEFIKRYPRVMENSLRRTDDRRKLKRVEVKDRKEKEKIEKMEDIKKLKQLKRQEIEEKLSKLREITGNSEVGFENIDFDEDFDPDAHDKKMQTLFNEEFYKGEEGDEKPEFPDLDAELEIERWDKYKGDEQGAEQQESEEIYEPNCEDDDFNMDADYDPYATQNELIENTRGKKKRKKKSRFAEALSAPKPAFDPDDKTYEEYIDEYYKLDCEDFIGDIPCRFKYRKVVPNSFGLTIDEILKAKDKELNRWCSLKKAVQIRPDHVEKYDQIAFGRKAQNEGLKRKVLPSLFLEEVQAGPSEKGKKRKKRDSVPNEDDLLNQSIEESNQNNKKSKKKKKIKPNEEGSSLVNCEDKSNDDSVKDISKSNMDKTSKKDDDTENFKNKSNGNRVKDVSKSKLDKITRIKQKDQLGKEDVNNSVLENNDQPDGQSENIVRKSKKKKKKNKIKTQEDTFKGNKSSEKQKHGKAKSNQTELSDARLQAFGIKPKRFKNKIKYGGKK